MLLRRPPMANRPWSVFASTGQTSLSWISQCRYLTCLDVTKEVARRNAGPAVVICSVETNLEIVEAARVAGALGYVFKKRVTKDLTVAVRSVVGANPLCRPADICSRRTIGRAVDFAVARRSTGGRVWRVGHAPVRFSLQLPVLACAQSERCRDLVQEIYLKPYAISHRFSLAPTSGDVC
jgi:hypothetical protein